ncbi:MAG: adenylosuccinate synthase [Candidatus Saccharibacteria bacterium]
MGTLVVVGAQWGDEGKGKITDFLAEEADCVVRYQGGANAGHTVEVGDQKFMLHLMPSGILYPDKICVIGNGVVLDMGELIKEIDDLQKRGISTENLRISLRAPVVMPYHKKLDAAREKSNKIGTTLRGIGPAYEDKISRVGFRMSDLLEPEEFKIKLQSNLDEKNKIFNSVYEEEGFGFDEVYNQLMEQIQVLKRYLADTSLLVYSEIKEGRKVLFEGAQGTLLDIDHGTYPYVTSSHPIAGGACTGTGIGPTLINRVLGVAKAYLTRVGEGPFPTELLGAEGDLLREKGGEYGTTTGRPRRCGWFDAVILRYAVRVNGLTDFALTKLDVLDGLPTIKICNGYRHKGQLLDEFPEDLTTLKECEPEYIEMPGWSEDTSRITRYEDLPANAKAYIEKLSELIGANLAIVAVGPGREQTIVCSKLF